MPQTPDPFVAWSNVQEYNAFSSTFAQACEKHLRDTQARLADILGPPAFDGIILYDRLERGMAIADLLARERRTLPRSGEGSSCDSHFDLDDLCDETNRRSLEAAMHEGSRAMLVRPNADPERRFILMDQREVARLHPIGRDKNPDLALATVGILAHEMAHARDYAEGRVALPSLGEIQARCAPEHAVALYIMVDMAIAEYVATRAECAAQVALHGGCSRNLTTRIGTMARGQMTLPALREVEGQDIGALQQQKSDLMRTGYVLGTLAAYRNAGAPIMASQDGQTAQTTTDLVERNLPKASVLTGMIKKIAPALERAVSSPDDKSPADLAGSLEAAFLSCREQKPPRRTRISARGEVEM